MTLLQSLPKRKSLFVIINRDGVATPLRVSFLASDLTREGHLVTAFVLLTVSQRVMEWLIRRTRVVLGSPVPRFHGRHWWGFWTCAFRNFRPLDGAPNGGLSCSTRGAEDGPIDACLKLSTGGLHHSAVSPILRARFHRESNMRSIGFVAEKDICDPSVTMKKIPDVQKHLRAILKNKSCIQGRRDVRLDDGRHETVNLVRTLLPGRRHVPNDLSLAHNRMNVTSSLGHDLLEMCSTRGHSIHQLRAAICVGSDAIIVDDMSFLLVMMLSSQTCVEITPQITRLAETCKVDDIVNAMIHRGLDVETNVNVFTNFMRVPELDRKTALILARMMTDVFPVEAILHGATRRLRSDVDTGEISLAMQRVVTRVGASLKARQRAATFYIQTVRSGM